MHTIIKIAVVSVLALFAIVGVMSVSKAEEIIMDCADGEIINEDIPALFQWEEKLKPNVSLRLNGKWIPFCNKDKLFKAFYEFAQNNLGDNLNDNIFSQWGEFSSMITFKENYLDRSASCKVTFDQRLKEVGATDIKFLLDFITHELTIAGDIFDNMGVNDMRMESVQCQPF